MSVQLPSVIDNQPENEVISINQHKQLFEKKDIQNDPNSIHPIDFAKLSKHGEEEPVILAINKDVEQLDQKQEEDVAEAQKKEAEENQPASSSVDWPTIDTDLLSFHTSENLNGSVSFTTEPKTIPLDQSTANCMMKHLSANSNPMLFLVEHESFNYEIEINTKEIKSLEDVKATVKAELQAADDFDLECYSEPLQAFIKPTKFRQLRSPIRTRPKINSKTSTLPVQEAPVVPKRNFVVSFRHGLSPQNLDRAIEGTEAALKILKVYQLDKTCSVETKWKVLCNVICRLNDQRFKLLLGDLSPAEYLRYCYTIMDEVVRETKQPSLLPESNGQPMLWSQYEGKHPALFVILWNSHHAFEFKSKIPLFLTQEYKLVSIVHEGNAPQFRDELFCFAHMIATGLDKETKSSYRDLLKHIDHQVLQQNINTQLSIREQDSNKANGTTKHTTKPNSTLPTRITIVFEYDQAMDYIKSFTNKSRKKFNDYHSPSKVKFDLFGPELQDKSCADWTVSFVRCDTRLADNELTSIPDCCTIVLVTNDDMKEVDLRPLKDKWGSRLTNVRLIQDTMNKKKVFDEDKGVEKVMKTILAEMKNHFGKDV